MKKKSSLSTDESRSLALIKRSAGIDDADIKSTNDEYDVFLKLTVENYLRCLLLESDDETDCFIMFRVFALLLANQSHSEILETIQTISNRIPSFKFIEVVPQITAHLNTSNDELGNLVHDIIRKLSNQLKVLNSS